jgi:putative GTP pyrophosphokinase
LVLRLGGTNSSKNGFTNFSQNEECISGYDYDEISRLLYGYRQGKINRFDEILFAGMGENYINLHKGDKEKWFRDDRIKRLNLLRESGIETKNYTPIT